MLYHIVTLVRFQKQQIGCLVITLSRHRLAAPAASVPEYTPCQSGSGFPVVSKAKGMISRPIPNAIAV
jgi:hypothetical protein